MSLILDTQGQISGQEPVVRLLEIYERHTRRYPLAEALFELSPKRALFKAMMKRDILRLEARLRDPTDDEIRFHEEAFYFLMRLDENGANFHIGGTNIYVERIMKLGTGLERHCETFKNEFDEAHLLDVGGKISPGDIAKKWGVPEASAVREQLVTKLKEVQSLDFPQLRSFEASKLFETALANGTKYTDALSRDHLLRGLWEAYRSFRDDFNKSSRKLVAARSLTRVLRETAYASQLLDATASCKKYLEEKNRAWLRTGIHAMLNSSARDILVTKEEGAMLLELNKAIRGLKIVISSRMDMANGLWSDRGDNGEDHKETETNDAQIGDKRMGLAVRKPRHRWVRRMGIDPYEGKQVPSVPHRRR